MDLILDAHQDLAYNMQFCGRDYSRSVTETRKLESGSPMRDVLENTLLGWPEYNEGGVGVVFGTLFASPFNPERPDRIIRSYKSIEEANQMYWDQLDFYKTWTARHPHIFQLILSRAALKAHVALWQDKTQKRLKPVGIIPLMEGAEGILGPHELPQWKEAGVHLIGLAWEGNQYCGGTRQPGPLTPAGKDLVREMARLGFVLDISHLDEESVWQVFDIFDGQIIASHANASSLIKGYKGNRMLSDDVIRTSISLGAVIGVVPYNGFLNREWKEDGGRDSVSLSMVAEQIDHICQIAGNTLHIGLGTDFDGGLGVESVPKEIDSIADIKKLSSFLSKRGFTREDITRIFSGNFLRVLESALPEQ